jgi:hypothetical protein
MDAGPERIADPIELDRVRRQARAVHLKAMITAVLATALAMLLPAGR